MAEPKRIVNSPSLTMTDTSNSSMIERNWEINSEKTSKDQNKFKVAPFKRFVDSPVLTPSHVLNHTIDDDEIYDDVIYDPKDRGQSHYNLRVRRYPKPYWITDGTSKRYGIQHKEASKAHYETVGKYENLLKKTKTNEEKFFAQQMSIAPRFLTVKDKMKLLQEHDLLNPETKQKKKRSARM